ncbi:MAG: hypothetical protein GX294_07110 [Candidatus Cloacimonetes bacterium]|nr:hypothetical protein [Candidatus Cloacimonadota bacterium]
MRFAIKQFNDNPATGQAKSEASFVYYTIKGAASLHLLFEGTETWHALHAHRFPLTKRHLPKFSTAKEITIMEE